MPVQKKRNEYVLLVDAQADDTFVRNTLDKIVVHKSLEKKEMTNDLATLILINYPHPKKNFILCNAEPVNMGTKLIFELLEENMAKATGMQAQCDWIEAVEYGADVFDPTVASTYIQTQVLVIISNFAVGSQQSVRACAMKLLARNVQLVAIADRPITYGTENIISCKKDMYDLMQQIDILEQDAVLGALCAMAKQCNGIVTGPGNVLNFLALVEQKPSKQDWRVGLMLGSFAFTTHTHKIFDRDGSMIHRVMPVKETMYRRRPADGADASTSNISVESPVPDDEVIKVRLYHGQPIVIPCDVVKSFKAKNRAAFTILGFVEPAQLPEMYYGGDDTQAVIADESNASAQHFREFVKVVFDAGLHAIAARVHRANTATKLFVLTPQRGGWFLMEDLCKGVHAAAYPVAGGVQQVDEGALAADMLALRHHLLSQSGRTLFAPQASLGEYRHAVVDNVRRLFGYSSKLYQQDEAFIQVQCADEVKLILDQLFRSEEAEVTDEPSADHESVPVGVDGSADEW